MIDHNFFAENYEVMLYYLGEGTGWMSVMETLGIEQGYGIYARGVVYMLQVDGMVIARHRQNNVYVRLTPAGREYCNRAKIESTRKIEGDCPF